MVWLGEHTQHYTNIAFLVSGRSEPTRPPKQHVHQHAVHSHHDVDNRPWGNTRNTKESWNATKCQFMECWDMLGRVFAHAKFGAGDIVAWCEAAH